MNIVLIGSGGREHALAYKLRESSSAERLFVIPGNPGTAAIAENVSLDVKDHKALIEFCKNEQVSFVVVGPEIPLVEGLADSLLEAGIAVFGPKADAARIEGDKAFTKALMQKYGIPTADFRTFNRQDASEAEKYLQQCSYPLVVKASGLAAGKGVLICQTIEEARLALKECFTDEVFGQSGSTVVIEEFMYGQEASIFAVTDGENFLCLPAAQDHKRIGDGDTGKNTGGMGAYAPAPIVTQEILRTAEETIIAPVLKAMKQEGYPFIGCLYAGLMLTEQGPKVVEFNCRFGDPETQAVLPLLQGDLARLLYTAATGDLDKTAVSYNGGAAVCVVLGSKGYPDSFEKGFEIRGLDEEFEPGVHIFHAGTKNDGDKIVTAGGRVLGVTAVTSANDLRLCKEKAYGAVLKLCYDNIYFRTDIADKAIK